MTPKQKQLRLLHIALIQSVVLFVSFNLGVWFEQERSDDVFDCTFILAPGDTYRVPKRELDRTTRLVTVHKGARTLMLSRAGLDVCVLSKDANGVNENGG